ncbi:peptidase M15 [Vibrio sp. Vb339]|uniref:peptidase M15 n=1 Tax=Vibrio sp. Vb339 TaxID=1192013 RepID=UPI0015573D6F|nr:peptidase M15 [Vibrio sp. Vb339]
MKTPTTVANLEKLGRVRLSPSFFMRDFLHSEIAQIEQLTNVPDYPDIALESGRNLCQKILEPISNKFGRISIRSGYRSPLVNNVGNEKKYNCASNDKNYGGHIWDYKDKDGLLGATACIVVNSFIPYYDETGHWQALAWWIHDNIPDYSDICFFPTFAAFNITWRESEPRKVIRSYIPEGKGVLTKPSYDNHHGSHHQEYAAFIHSLVPN